MKVQEAVKLIEKISDLAFELKDRVEFFGLGAYLNYMHKSEDEVPQYFVEHYPDIFSKDLSWWENHFRPQNKKLAADSELFSVCALVFNNDGKVLSCSRRGLPTDLGLPGGKIDKGETPREALVRELREETGCIATEFYTIFERTEEDNKVCRVYYVHKFTNEPHDMEEGINVKWVDPEELMDDNCSFREYNKRLFAAIKVS